MEGTHLAKNILFVPAFRTLKRHLLPIQILALNKLRVMVFTDVLDNVPVKNTKKMV